MKPSIAISVLLALAIAGTADAKKPSPTSARLTGRVIALTRAVGGAKVSVHRLGLRLLGAHHDPSKKTGPHGGFTFVRPPGNYEVHAWKRNVGSGTVIVPLIPGQTTQTIVAIYQHIVRLHQPIVVPHMTRTTKVGPAAPVAIPHPSGAIPRAAVRPAPRLAQLGTSGFHPVAKPIH